MTAYRIRIAGALVIVIGLLALPAAANSALPFQQQVEVFRSEEGDVIALFTLAADVPEVERLLQVSIDFF